MPQETTAQLVKELRNARRLFGPDWAKRIAAAQALGAQRAGEAVSDLAAVIQENQNPDLVQATLQALSQIGTPQAVDALIAILCGGDVKQRELASQLLVNLGPVVAGRSLLSTAGISSATDRNAVESVLKQYGDIAPWLISLLANSDVGIRNSAQQRLVTSGAAAVPALLDALINDADPAMSQAIAETLSKIGQPALGPLIRIFAESEASEAAKAAETLVGLGQLAVSALIDVLSHKSLRARKLASETLLQIEASEAWVLQPLLSYWTETDVAPRTLIVDPSGNGDFMTLTEAVTAAPDHTLIRLSSGVHTLPEPLEIEKPLVFFGDGMNTCRVVCRGRWYVVRWTGQGIFGAAGIGFERRSDEWGAVLEASSGELRLRACKRITYRSLRRIPAILQEVILLQALSGCSFQGGTMWGRPDEHGRTFVQEELTARGLSDRKLT